MGGDGLLQEVVTGMMRNPDRAGAVATPIGILPVGMANMYAHSLYDEEDITSRTIERSQCSKLPVQPYLCI